MKSKKFNESKEELCKKEIYSKEMIRRCYLFTILDSIDACIYPRNINKYLEESFFNKIIKEERISLQNYNGYSNNYSFSWSEIQKKVDKYDYQTNLNILENISNGNIQEIENTIKKLELQISDLNNCPIKKIPNLNSFVKETNYIAEKKPNCDLISYLLLNGFIDENYYDYISYFYPGSLSYNDKKFLLLIKNKKEPVFNLELSNIENIVSRIREEEWDNSAILNNYLLSYLLEQNNINKIQKIISVMILYRETEFFFDQYKNSNCEKQNLFYMWINNFIIEKGYDYSVLFSETNYDAFFQLFLAVERLNNDKFVYFVKDNVDFLAREMDESAEKRVLSKLIKMNVKFALSRKIIEYPIVSKLIENNLYEITKDNLMKIIKIKSNENSSGNSILTEISNLKDDKLTEYIYEDINKTLDKVILSNVDGIQESEVIFKSIINNPNITYDRKDYFIKLNNTCIDDINGIEKEFSYTKDDEEHSFNIWEALFKTGKITPLWKNIYSYYEETNELTSEIKEYISNNISSLIKREVISKEEKNDVKSESHKLIINFFGDILGCNDFDLNTYEQLLSVTPWSYNSISNYDLDEIHLLALCISGKLVLSENNYTKVREKSVEACTRLISKYFDTLFEAEKRDYVLDEDVLNLIPTGLISIEQKKKLFMSDKINWNSISDKSVLDIYKVLVDESLSIKTSITLARFIEVIRENIHDNDKIMMFILLQINSYSKQEVFEGLNLLGTPYSEILTNGAKEIPIEDTEINKKICDLFEEKHWISSYRKNKEGKLSIRRLR